MPHRHPECSPEIKEGAEIKPFSSPSRFVSGDERRREKASMMPFLG
jgi:hypothetical protein